MLLSQHKSMTLPLRSRSLPPPLSSLQALKLNILSDPFHTCGKMAFLTGDFFIRSTANLVENVAVLVDRGPCTVLGNRAASRAARFLARFREKTLRHVQSVLSRRVGLHRHALHESGQEAAGVFSQRQSKPSGTGSRRRPRCSIPRRSAPSRDTANPRGS